MIVPFRKPLIGKIVQKHKKLFASEAFQMVVETNESLMKMFDGEKSNCRYFDDDICGHKNGHGNCFILDCPYR